MAAEDTGKSIVKMALTFAVALIILSAIFATTEDQTVTYSSGSITITGNPLDEDTLTINSIIFEFDNEGNFTEGNVNVSIADDYNTTISNLKTAINAQSPGVSAS